MPQISDVTSATRSASCQDSTRTSGAAGRAAFVRLLLSDARVPIDEISRLRDHSGTTVTELVYRHRLRPLIETGTTIMDDLFGTAPGDSKSEPTVFQGQI